MLTINMTLKKETKNTFRFEERADVPVIGTLYVQKWACKELGMPKQIVVTITNKEG